MAAFALGAGENGRLMALGRAASLIPALREQAGQAAGPIQRRALQYRPAKPYHFAGDGDMAQVCLKQAGKNLQKTVYAGMISMALENRSALERH